MNLVTFLVNCISNCLAIAGQILQLLAINSNSWVILIMLRSPLCYHIKPTDYEAACPQVHYFPQEVGRAGMWQMCHLFPIGLTPHFYYDTEPYCSNFAEDVMPAWWLEMSQFLCQLAIILNAIGIAFSVFADMVRIGDVNWAASAILYISAICGFLGAVTYYMNMSKNFLLYHRLDIIVMQYQSGFYCVINGSALSLVAALLRKQTKI